MKTEEMSNKIAEDIAKAKEAPTAADNRAPAETEAATGTAEKNDDVNIDDHLEETGQDSVGKTAEETWGLIEELEEIKGTTDESAEVKAEGVTEISADSPETKGSEEAAKTAEIEEVKEVFNARDESSEAKTQIPSNDTEVKSIDIKDFKKLLEEREAERQSLKNKVKELEETLIKKTQKLDQKIEECKSFQKNEKELLAIYKELKDSSISP